MDPLLVFGLCAAIFLVSVANSFIGERVIAPRAGEYAAHLYRSLVSIAVIFAAGWIYAVMSGAGKGTVSASVAAGSVWLVMTVLFDFALGHYVLEAPWEKILVNYRIHKGRLSALVLLSTFAAPPLMTWLAGG